MKTETVTGDWRSAARVLLDRVEAELAELTSCRESLLRITTPGAGTEIPQKVEKVTKGERGILKRVKARKEHLWKTAAPLASKLDRSPVERPGDARQDAAEPAGRMPALQRMTPAEARAWLATAPEPFSTESIMAGTGLDADQARNLLCRLRMQERIEKVSYGQWKRTANYTAD